MKKILLLLANGFEAVEASVLQMCLDGINLRETARLN